MKEINGFCVSTFLCWVSSLLMAVALYLVFFYAPTEQTMGVVQRIFYFHVSAAWIAFLAFFIVMVASVAYLMGKDAKWDRLAYASAEIGTLFCTIVMLTGPLWAKPVWNVWWSWDMRLTTTLVLWLMYLGYLMLRRYAEGERGAKYAAVFGIFAFLDVPFVYFSVKWWRTLHPGFVVASGGEGGLAPGMLATLLFCLVTFFTLFLYLLQYRVALMNLEIELDKIREAIFEQSAPRGLPVENQDFVIEEYNFFQETPRS